MSLHAELRWVRGRRDHAARRLLNTVGWWGGWFPHRHLPMVRRLLMLDAWVLDLRRQLAARAHEQVTADV